MSDENENNENMKIISFITILQKNLKLLKNSSPYDRLILLKVRNVTYELMMRTYNWL